MHMHTVRHITAALIAAALITACGKEAPPPAPKAEAPKPERRDRSQHRSFARDWIWKDAIKRADAIRRYEQQMFA